MTSKEAAIIKALFFCTLEQTEEISCYCHEDTDPALLGGITDQHKYLPHLKPECNHLPYIPSNNNFFSVCCIHKC